MKCFRYYSLDKSFASLLFSKMFQLIDLRWELNSYVILMGVVLPLIIESDFDQGS